MIAAMDACHTHPFDAPCTSEGRKEGQPADMFGGKRGLQIWPGRWGQPCATLQHILYTIYNYTTTTRPHMQHVLSFRIRARTCC